MGVDEGNLQVIDVDVRLGNCPTTIPLRTYLQVAIMAFIIHIISYILRRQQEQEISRLAVVGIYMGF